jgi:hypothetical protein
MSKAVLTCCVCFSVKEVPADSVIEGLDLETWWLDVRRQTCAACFAHTCWEPMEEERTVCFLDKGHPGRHLPWKDEYGDTDPEVRPLVDLWS